MYKTTILMIPGGCFATCAVPTPMIQRNSVVPPLVTTLSC